MMMSMSPSDQITTLYGDRPPAVITLQEHPKVNQKVRNYYGKYKAFNKSKNTEKATEIKKLALKEMLSIGLTEKDLMTCIKFFKSVDKANNEKLKYARASELGSPAPKGHFLRIFGASDREFIDNSSREGSTPQALEMMNGFVNWGVLQQPQSVLARDIKKLNMDETIDYLYLALLTRRPTPAERAHLLKFSETDAWTNKRDMAWAIVNGPEFSFYY